MSNRFIQQNITRQQNEGDGGGADNGRSGDSHGLYSGGGANRGRGEDAGNIFVIGMPI